MATLAKLVVKLVADVSEFSKSMDSAATKLTKVSNSMMATGAQMTKYLTVPLVGAGVAAVKLASDLEETKNKTSVVFGAMADDIFKFTDNAAKDFGMTRNEALGYASTIGSMVANTGLATSKMVDMSKALTSLAGDYSSFHNISTDAAFQKIFSGMVGESEPLKALGKDLSQTAVKAYALANGITANAEAMSNAELVQARFGLLLSQSSMEMGDYIRTADSLANSTKTATKLFQEVLTKFGETLIPVATDFMLALIPLLDRLNQMPEPVRKNIVSFLGLAAVAGPVIQGLAGIGKGVAWVMKLFGTGGLAGSATAATTAVSGTTGALSTIGTALAAVSLPVWGLIGALGALFLAIKFAGPQAAEAAYQLLFIIKFKLQQLVSWFQSAGRNLMVGLIKGVQSATLDFVSAVLRPVQFVIEQVKRMLKISSPSGVFAGIGENMMLGMAEGINKFAPIPIDASITATNDTFSGINSAGVGKGRGNVVNHNEFVFYGDISESAKKNLKSEIGKLFDEKLEQAFS